MFKFENMDDNRTQVKLLIEVAEQLIHYFADEECKVLAKQIIQLCQNWLQNINVIPEALYRYLDSEDDLTVVQNRCEGYDADIWECYLYIVGYVCKMGFLYSDLDYQPQILDELDESCYDEIKDICEYIDIIPEDMFDKIEKQFIK